MKTTHPSAKSLKITALSVEDAAKVLASAYGRRVTEAQVRHIAEEGALIRPDGTINLLDYVAFLVQEIAHAPTPAPGSAPGCDDNTGRD